MWINTNMWKFTVYTQWFYFEFLECTTAILVRVTVKQKGTFFCESFIYANYTNQARSHKFVSHKFLSRHTSQYMDRFRRTNKNRVNLSRGQLA